MNMQDTIEKIDSLIASDNSEAAINLILTLDDPKLNGHILKGCTIDEYGNVKIDAGYLADSTMKHYLFYTVLCLLLLFHLRRRQLKVEYGYQIY